MGEYMGSPLDLVVNSDGYIIVLGSTRQGMRLFTFDYDGLYLGHFNSDESAVELAGTSSLAIDDQDRVYALIHSEGVVVRCGTHGEIQQTFPVEDDIEEEEQLERVYGSMYFAGGLLYVPISSHGTVMRLTPDGKLVDNIGFKGTLIGQLNFPVCVAVTSDGIIMILDKHRFNIVCFSQKGKFLAEFGGKGTSPGWFYHPTWIAIDGSEQVYIGQIFNNRIQVLSIPQLVYDRKSKVDGQATRNPAIDTQIGVETSNNQSSRRWSRNELSAFDCVEDDILHEQISLKLTVPKNPIQLAFTESVGGIYNA